MVISADIWAFTQNVSGECINAPLRKLSDVSEGRLKLCGVNNNYLFTTTFAGVLVSIGAVRQFCATLEVLRHHSVRTATHPGYRTCGQDAVSPETEKLHGRWLQI